MNPMKLLYPFFALMLLSVSLSFAQSGNTTTNPVSTTSTNRQQELYDQYHGITKKAPATTVTTPASRNAGTQQQSTSYSTTTPTRSQSQQSQRVSSESNTSGVRIGLRGGATSTFFTETQPLIKSAIGYVGGLTFNFGAGRFSFQPEVNYARYGLKLSDDFTGISLKGAADVIEVPLFLKISSGTYDGHRFFVNIGPYGSYLASISVEGKKQAIDNSIGRFGFGAAAGVGAALKAGPGHVTVEARGLYSFGDTEDGFSTDSRAIRTQLTIGYSFPLGGR